MTLPTLTTERLLLRQRSLDDIPGYLEMDADAEVMRYIGDGTVPDLATHAERIKQRIITGNADGLWVWSVFERDRPADLLGCMFLSLEEELEKIELAYRFRRSAWGRGIATEASVVCLRYGFETLRLSEIIALAYPENAPSQRVLSKLGFEAAGRHYAYGKSLLLFRLAADTFRKNHSPSR
jgi:ribosomal-protein-alanine N-acetyltransferase